MPLTTLMTLFCGYVAKTDILSVPMATVVPAATVDGMLITKISVTKPTVELAATSPTNLVDSEVTPILCSFVRPGTNVDRPEMAIWSFSKNVCDGETCTDTWLALSQTRTLD